MSSGASLTSCGEVASLVLGGNPSNDVVTIKMPYGVDVLHRPASGLVKIVVKNVVLLLDQLILS